MPNQRASGPLTDRQLAALAAASLQSAIVLISDASDLNELGSVPHAYATAILAGEEFGKCQLAVGAVGHIASVDKASEDRYWKQFWRSFYGHGQKLVRAAWIAKAWIPDELVAAFVALLDGALFSQRREAGLYVDVIDGRVFTPGEAISDAEAGEALDVIGGVIAAYRSIFGAGLAEFLLQPRPDAKRMRAALDGRDIKHVKRLWIETTGKPLDDSMTELIRRGWAAEDAAAST